MKKIVLMMLMIISMVSMPLMSDTVYDIDTSYGREQVVIPDGYTEKDVLLVVSRAYYEQTRDLESLREINRELVSESESYISENRELRKKYDLLLENYGTLVEKMSARRRQDVIKAYVGGQYSHYRGRPGGGLSAGAVLFDRLVFTSSVDYLSYGNGLCVSAGVGFMF